MIDVPFERLLTRVRELSMMDCQLYFTYWYRYILGLVQGVINKVTLKLAKSFSGGQYIADYVQL